MSVTIILPLHMTVTKDTSLDYVRVRFQEYEEGGQSLSATLRLSFLCKPIPGSPPSATTAGSVATAENSVIGTAVARTGAEVPNVAIEDNAATEDEVSLPQ